MFKLRHLAHFLFMPAICLREAGTGEQNTEKVSSTKQEIGLQLISLTN